MSNTVNAIFYLAAGGMVISGLLSIISPETAWYLSEGWRYKNLEPSEEYLRASRIWGLIGVIAGVLIFVWLQSESQSWPVFP